MTATDQHNNPNDHQNDRNNIGKGNLPPSDNTPLANSEFFEGANEKNKEFRENQSSNDPSTERHSILGKLSDESFQTFVHLIADKEDFTEGVKNIRIIPRLITRFVSEDLEVSFLEKLLEEFDAITEDYSSKVKSYQSLDSKTVATRLYNLNNQCARAIQEKLDKAIWNSGKDIAMIMSLQAAKCIIQYHISDESIPHETNIKIASRALYAKLPGYKLWSEFYRKFSWYDRYKKFYPSDLERQSVRFQRTVAEITKLGHRSPWGDHFRLMTNEGHNYIHLSPHFYRALKRTIDETISNTLDGEAVNINKSLELLRNKIKPYQTLLQDLGGDIQCERFRWYSDIYAAIKWPQAEDDAHLLHQQSFWDNDWDLKNYPNKNLDNETGICEPLTNLYTQGFFHKPEEEDTDYCD